MAINEELIEFVEGKLPDTGSVELEPKDIRDCFVEVINNLEGGTPGGPVAWAEITGKPTTFAPAPHTHPIADVSGLQAALDAKAALVHTHAIADVTGLQTALNGKQATLVSGTNIKTINGEAITGSGDIVVSGGAEENDLSRSYVYLSDFCSPDGKQRYDASTLAGNHIVTSQSAGFASSDVGKLIEIVFPGSAPTLVTTITGFNNAASVTVQDAPQTTAAGGVARITFGTDCTEGIQEALEYAFDSNKRKVFAKNGIYMMNGPIIETYRGKQVRCQVVIPWDIYGISPDAFKRGSITIEGEFPPSASDTQYAVFGATDFDYTLPATNGTIFYSTLQAQLTNDVNDYPRAVFGTAGYDVLGVEVNFAGIFLENFIVRVQWHNALKTPHMSGINMIKANSFFRKNILVDTNAAVVTAGPASDDYIHVGIIMPQINTHVAHGATGCSVNGGFWAAFLYGEHSKALDDFAGACYHGFMFGANGHPATLGHVTTHNCAYQVSASPGMFGRAAGPAIIKVNMLTVERVVGPAPQVFNFKGGVYDLQNYLGGDVSYCLSNSAANGDGTNGHDNADFTFLGGEGLQRFPLGDPWLASKVGPLLTAFSSGVQFDRYYRATSVEQSANITFTLNTTDQIPEGRHKYTIVSDGTSTVALPAAVAILSGSDTFTPEDGRVYTFDFSYNGVDHDVVIKKGGIPVVIGGGLYDALFNSAENISESPDNTWINDYSGASVSQHAKGIDTTHVIVSGNDVIYYCDYDNSDKDNTIIGLDDSSVFNYSIDFSGNGLWRYSVVMSGGSLFAFEQGTQEVQGIAVLPYASANRFGIRVRNASTTPIIEAVISTNGGSTWSLSYTFTGTYAGSLYAKLGFTVAGKKIGNPKLLIS